LHARRRDSKLLQRRTDLPDSARVLIDKEDFAGASGQGFQPQRAGAGKQIETARIADCRLQPVKDGFAHAIGRRPNRRARGEPQPSASPLAADDSQLIRDRGTLCSAAWR
jgi:hypothetical protein